MQQEHSQNHPISDRRNSPDDISTNHSITKTGKHSPTSMKKIGSSNNSIISAIVTLPAKKEDITEVPAIKELPILENLNKSADSNDDVSDNVESTAEETKALFWKTLSFWQRTSEVGEVKEPDEIENADVVISQTRTQDPQQAQELFPPASQGSGYTTTDTVITNSIWAPNPTTLLADETVTKSDINIAIVDDNSPLNSHDDTNFIWNITRRVSTLPAALPFLQQRQTSLMDDELAPNRCSEVIAVSRDSVETNNIRSVLSESDKGKNEPVQSDSWWTPWRWNFYESSKPNVNESVSELGSGIMEDELLKLQRKEVSNQIKVQSYGIPKAITWGSMHHLNDNFENVLITGNSYKKPVMLKKMPQSMFEINENGLIKKNDTESNQLTAHESIVLPDLSWNYRDLTWRTRCRITLSKIPILESFFSPQVHLYADNTLRCKHKNLKKPIKKVVVLSFHGFFPQKIVRNIIGEPTGTAEQMNKMAIAELERWSKINNVELNINVINLEGHGKIFERVNGCLSILDNWTDIISESDYILAVANSISVPLAIHALAKLITSNVFDDVKKLGLIGFSGILMGPFPEVESKINTRGSVGQDNDIISEMFDLEDPDSLQSKEIIRNMRILLKKNFKITFIGSLNDCFAPLYSSLGLHLLHPNIYRALYVDGKDHQPDFLVSLFNLILTVRNLNYTDHGLLVELSNFFSSQIGDGGHSKVLNNKYGYRIGINNMLNTSDLLYQQTMIEDSRNLRENNVNNYHIPWSLRGFIQELNKLQKHFDVEQIIEQLFEEFKSWEPQGTKRKELKYCMEAFENVLNEDFGL